MSSTRTESDSGPEPPRSAASMTPVSCWMWCPNSCASTYSSAKRTAGRAEPGLQLVVEPEVEVDRLVGRAVERAGRAGRARRTRCRPDPRSSPPRAATYCAPAAGSACAQYVSSASTVADEAALPVGVRLLRRCTRRASSPDRCRRRPRRRRDAVDDAGSGRRRRTAHRRARRWRRCRRRSHRRGARRRRASYGRGHRRSCRPPRTSWRPTLAVRRGRRPGSAARRACTRPVAEPRVRAPGRASRRPRSRRSGPRSPSVPDPAGGERLTGRPGPRHRPDGGRDEQRARAALEPARPGGVACLVRGRPAARGPTAA